MTAITDKVYGSDKGLKSGLKKQIIPFCSGRLKLHRAVERVIESHIKTNTLHT